MLAPLAIVVQRDAGECEAYIEKAQCQRRTKLLTHPKMLSLFKSLWRIDKKALKDERDHCSGSGRGHLSGITVTMCLIYQKKVIN